MPIAAIELEVADGKRILLPPGEDRATEGHLRLRRAAVTATALLAVAMIGAGGWITWQT